jgi:hypothetical protein
MTEEDWDEARALEILNEDMNEVYEITHPPGAEHDIPADWWTVTCNGIPVHHFSPSNRRLAERYASDPEYRKSLVTTKLHDKKP